MLFGDVWFVVGWNHLLVADLKYFMTFPLFGMMIPTDRRRFPKMVVPPNYPNSSIFSIWNLWGSPNFFETPKKCCHSWNALFNHQSSYDDPWRLHSFVDDLATPPVFLPQWPRFHAGDVLGMLYADGLPVGVLSLKGKVHWIGAGRCHIEILLGTLYQPCQTLCPQNYVVCLSKLVKCTCLTEIQWLIWSSW